MDRRNFVRIAAGGIATGSLSSMVSSCSEDPLLSEDPFLKWTWVHGGGDRTPADWRAQYARLAEAGFFGVLVSGGETEVHAQAAHEAGLQFHRWTWTLNRNGDEWVRSNHPEWFTVSREGNSSFDHPPYVDYYRWLCPTKPEVREYLGQVFREIARTPGMDGVHLDYVRHSDVILPRGLWSKYDLIQDREYPEFDFCYCDTCRRSFKARHGYDPLELPDPSADEAWRRFRWDAVTGLVEVLADVIHEEGKPVTAAVFPTPTIARNLVRQAWDEWPVDAVFPMLYHNFYEEGLQWIGEGVAGGLAALATGGEGAAKERQLFAGLYLPSLSEDERSRAEEIARNAGAHGVSFFEMGGLRL